MGEVIQFPDTGNLKRTSVQVSYYRQRDGSQLFIVEKLLTDGTWDRIGHTSDLAEAWKIAGKLAIDNGWELLPKSRWPGHSHLLSLSCPLH